MGGWFASERMLKICLHPVLVGVHVGLAMDDLPFRCIARLIKLNLMNPSIPTSRLHMIYYYNQNFVFDSDMCSMFGAFCKILTWQTYFHISGLHAIECFTVFIFLAMLQSFS